MTGGQSASLSWNKTPIWSLRPDFYYCQTVTGLLMWGALSDESRGLSLTIAAGPRQRSHFLVWVLWDSWPYFTVSYSRLPFSSPPTTRRATVEVFDPASTEGLNTTWKCILYLTRNTLRFRYKDQSVNAVLGYNRCLLREPHETQKYTVREECRVLLY
jgi:hypothetical protein